MPDTAKQTVQQRRHGKLTLRNKKSVGTRRALAETRRNKQKRGVAKQ